MDIRIPLPSMIRHQVQNADYLWAQIVSNVLSPPVVWAIWVYPIALAVTPSPDIAYFHATLFTLLVCLMPMVYIVLMVKMGKIGDLHMRESHERYIPYSVSIVAGCITMAILYPLGAHPVLLILTLISIVQLSIMLIGTFFSHISAHAMAITSVTSATALIFGLSRSYLVVPIVMLVVLARLVLNRHTPTQIVIGTLIGTLTPFAVIFSLYLIL
jgi:membrane-associated phospholipid phosphatase